MEFARVANAEGHGSVQHFPEFGVNKGSKIHVYSGPL
jgi:hypothetical protein